MLTELSIKNIALIESVDIEFGSGLNVLTGETGAGKSIIIDSINAILGGRASRELIRSGESKAIIQAVFKSNNESLAIKLSELGIECDDDNSLVFSREFSTTGKNSCRINGIIVTVSMLREIGSFLIDLHGQHDNQSLLNTTNHIKLLDSFGGEEVCIIKTEYIKLLDEWRKLNKSINEISGNIMERERKIDLYRFQIDEIKKAKLKINEEEELSKQRIRLANSEKLMSCLTNAYAYLFSGEKKATPVMDSLNKVVGELTELSKIDSSYLELSKSVESIHYQIEDIAAEVRNLRDNVEYNPRMLEEIEERLDFIYRLKRKYGSSIEQVLNYCFNIEKSLEDLVNSEQRIDELVKKAGQIEERLYKLALNLNAKRLESAELIEKRIGIELSELDMKKAKFKVRIDFNAEKSEKSTSSSSYEFTEQGLDDVEFLISANAGEPLKPLAKIASGGEMSRIMLAIKTILADIDEVPTLIFDEIDTGISGKAAGKVGEKLSDLSGRHQIICVTHLPQIASMADSHFLIEKNQLEDRTITHVRILCKKESEKELARILSGEDITDITIRHAQEMMNKAKKLKTN